MEVIMKKFLSILLLIGSFQLVQAAPLKPEELTNIFMDVMQEPGQYMDIIDTTANDLLNDTVKKIILEEQIIRALETLVQEKNIFRHKVHLDKLQQDVARLIALDAQNPLPYSIPD